MTIAARIRRNTLSLIIMFSSLYLNNVHHQWRALLNTDKRTEQSDFLISSSAPLIRSNYRTHTWLSDVFMNTNVWIPPPYLLTEIQPR